MQQKRICDILSPRFDCFLRLAFCMFWMTAAGTRANELANGDGEQQRPSEHAIAQASIEAKNKEAVNARFDQAVSHQRQDDIDAFMDYLKTIPSERERYRALYRELDEFSDASAEHVSFILAIAAEQVRMAAGGQSDRNLRKTFDMVVDLAAKGYISTSDINALIQGPFDMYADRYRGNLELANKIHYIRAHLAEAYLMHEYWDEAARLYKEVAAHPSIASRQFHTGLIQAYHGAGRLKELDAEIRHDRYFRSGRYLGDLYNSLGQYDKTLSLYEAYLANPEGLRSIKRQLVDATNETRAKLNMPPMAIPDELIPSQLSASSSSREGTIRETPHMRNLRLSLQAKHRELSRVNVNTTLESVMFETVDLSHSMTHVDGNQYYAFKFATPEEGGNMYWAFKSVGGVQSWYIIPVEGQMHGFSNFNRIILPEDIPDVGNKHDLMFIQQLPGRNLRPKDEYIMWFRMHDALKPEVTLSLNIFPESERHSFPAIFPMLFREPITIRVRRVHE